MPFSISAFLIKNVLQKLAKAPAPVPTKVFNNKTLLPVTFYAIPRVMYLRISAIDRLELSAAK